jgi:anion-transporting  ArsA/GET3 family ATPase
MASPLDKRLVFVTGKGGTGKTVVSAALGLVAARQGKRTMVCEVAAQERIPALFGRRGAGFEEVEIAERMYAISVDPEHAREEWLRFQLRSGALAGVLNSSRIFSYLAAAAPGLAELVTVGKVWELAQLERKTAKASPYDVVIVDAPATGHGVAMLRSAKTFRDAARVGPVASQAGKIHSFLADPRRTAVVAVALAEDMPVNETLDLGDRLEVELGQRLAHIVANAIYPERFSGADAEAIAAADGRPSEAARDALEAALSEHNRARAQRSHLRRLKKDAEAPVTTLPFLFEPEIGAPEVEALSHELERKLA